MFIWLFCFLKKRLNVTEDRKCLSSAFVHAQSLSHVWYFATVWTIAFQAPLSMWFLKQEHWSRLPFPPAEDLSHQGSQPTSPASSALTSRFFTVEPSGKPFIAFVHKWYLDRIYHLRIMLSSKKLFTTFRYCVDMLNLKLRVCKKYMQWQKLISKLEIMMGWCEYRISRCRNNHRIHREITLSAFTSI